MKATHNIKVNGRWVHAGEEYAAAEAVQMEIGDAPEAEAQEDAPEAEEHDEEEISAEEPQKTTRRGRKKA